MVSGPADVGNSQEGKVGAVPDGLHAGDAPLSLQEYQNKLRHKMGYPSITGFVESFTSLFKIAILFNISPYVSVDKLISQKNLPYLLSNMACNIACNIHMDPSFTQERKFTKPMKYHINFSSNQGMHK